MRVRELPELVDHLEPKELEVLRERIEARLTFLSRAPGRVARRVLDPTTLARADDAEAGQVADCHEGIGVSRTDSHGAPLEDLETG